MSKLRCYFVPSPHDPANSNSSSRGCLWWPLLRLLVTGPHERPLPRTFQQPSLPSCLRAGQGPGPSGEGQPPCWAICLLAPRACYSGHWSHHQSPHPAARGWDFSGCWAGLWLGQAGSARTQWVEEKGFNSVGPLAFKG